MPSSSRASSAPFAAVEACSSPAEHVPSPTPGRLWGYGPTIAPTFDGSSGELDRCVPAELVQLVAGVDLANRARPRAHHERLRGRAARVVVHSFQHFTVGDARDGEEAVVAGHE